MTIALATELHETGKAHSWSSCLLYRASIEYAHEEGIDDPQSYAFNGAPSLSIHYLLGLGLELNQVLHLIAAGAWLGGLPPLVWLLREARRPDGDRAHDLLRHTFDLLTDPFDFLFGTLTANRCHPVPSAHISNKNCSALATSGNAERPRSRLTGQET